MAASLPSHAILAAAAGASCISSGRRAAQAAPALRRPALCQRRRLAAAAAPAAAATALLEPASIKIVKLDRKLERAQQTLLGVIAGVEGRGKGGLTPEQQAAFDEAVAILEADGGVEAPTTSPLLDGRWALLFTSRPGTASPIQRTFTAVDSVSVYQDIEVGDECEQARVSQVVDFGSAVGFLRVEAEANTDSRPLPGFTPRVGQGLPFGIMGKSSTGPPARPDMRVGFQFDRAAFTLKALPFKIPYPVPFKLLGDERKGWIDVTYLSPDGRLRLSRGNKGTLFVLQKEVAPRDRLLAALAARGGRDDDEIEALAEEVAASGEGVPRPAASPLAAGKWRLLWTRQGQTANPLQKALANQVENFQLISEDGGRLENLVCLLPGLRVRASAACGPEEGDSRTRVDIDEVTLEVGPAKLPLPIRTYGRGFVEWLHLDQELRVTRGNKGSLFIHVRDDA